MTNKKRCQITILIFFRTKCHFSNNFRFVLHTHCLRPVFWVNLFFQVFYCIYWYFFLSKSKIVLSQQCGAGYNNWFFHVIYKIYVYSIKNLLVYRQEDYRLYSRTLLNLYRPLDHSRVLFETWQSFLRFLSGKCCVENRSCCFVT